MPKKIKWSLVLRKTENKSEANFSILRLTYYSNCQPQNPKFRNNPENFHQLEYLNT